MCVDDVHLLAAEKRDQVATKPECPTSTAVQSEQADTGRLESARNDGPSATSSSHRGYARNERDRDAIES